MIQIIAYSSIIVATFLASFLALTPSLTPEVLMGRINSVTCPCYHLGITQAGLAYSSKEWLKEVKMYDSLFKDFHRDSKDGILRCEGVVRKFRELLERNFPNSDKKIIATFAISRTTARMNAIARKLAVEKQETLRHNIYITTVSS